LWFNEERNGDQCVYYARNTTLIAKEEGTIATS